MSEILQYVITSLVTLLAGGGIGSIFFFRQQRKLKDLEVKAQEADVKSDEISNLSASNEEWIKLYDKVQAENDELKNRISEFVDKLEEVHNSKKELWERFSNCQMESSKKDLVINELNWYRCELNGCPYRKPPRKFGDQDFPKDALNPETHPDPECL